jgi:hypothetical protein
LYGLHSASVVDAPAIDAAGNVIFGTDSGYLLKVDANLSSPIQRLHLIRIGEDNRPMVGSDGNILVVGRNALFCVVGCPEGPLDPLAPWPKWQRDLYNTGYVGGGR